MSKHDKNIFNYLRHTQINNCDVNFLSNLSQEFLSVDIRLKNKTIKEIKRTSENLFQSDKTLNAHLHIYFDSNNHDFKNIVVNST